MTNLVNVNKIKALLQLIYGIHYLPYITLAYCKSLELTQPECVLPWLALYHTDIFAWNLWVQLSEVIYVHDILQGHIINLSRMA